MVEIIKQSCARARHWYALLWSTLIEEWLLSISAFGLILTSLYLKKFPLYSSKDFQVIYILFVLFVIVKGLDNSNFFSKIASLLETRSFLPVKLVALTMLLSMFVTNDVALLIIVPLTLNLKIEKKGLLVIFEALAANAGSALTPFGNPQNLFIYWFYHLHPLDFFQGIFKFIFINIFIIIITFFYFKNARQNSKNAYASATITSHSAVSAANLTSSAVPGSSVANRYIYLTLLFLFIAAIMRLLPISVGIIAIFYSLLFDRKSLQIDYLLLATFLCFFGFTDNLMAILKFHFNTSSEVFWYSALTSQLISNVPSTLLFADFTRHCHCWKALLWGVNVGGFGTLISSLANLIAYRLYYRGYSYQKNDVDTRNFLLKFHLYGFLMFCSGCILYLIF